MVTETSDEVDRFDDTFDVVVAGFGFAGAVAALEASRVGARVLLIEKSAVPGGISICSYGGAKCAREAEQAFRYLKATNGGRTPEDVTSALACGMTEIEDYVRELARANDAEVETSRHERKIFANYPLAGAETFYHTSIASIPNFDPKAVYPWANGAEGGRLLFKVLDDNVAAAGIEVRLATRALRLITRGYDREVIGLTVAGAKREQRIRTLRGVVLACGGFEGCRNLQDQYWEGAPVLAAAARHNTGDGIMMAQDLGAGLWHMWHAHGGYGFRHFDPDYPYAIRVKRLPDWMPTPVGAPLDHSAVSTTQSNPLRMPWILLDRYGRRFMNEYEPYLQDTAHRSFFKLDPAIQGHPRIPAALICDEDGRKLYPFGQPTSNDPGVHYDWSADNLKEVDNGILTRDETLDGLAEQLGLNAAAATTAVEIWNKQCDDGTDSAFGRPRISMVPIRRPPFYGAPVWPVVSNTQGGPVRDAQSRVLTVYGAPIPRLYSAGELGSAFGYLYLGGGNISECLITGRTAGRNAALLPTS
jgi:succinate dehydrogenase/fumarate reductase flavoprotein subunit